MSLSTTVQSAVTVVETLTGPFVDPKDATVTVDGLNETITLTGTTTPAATKQAAFRQAMTAGAVTIDLTALPGLTGDEVVNGTGLKVQALKVRNLAANANKLSVGKGASNGYGLDAAGDVWSVNLSPGQSALFNLDGAGPTIGSSAKTLDVAGTGTQVLELHVVMG